MPLHILRHNSCKQINIMGKNNKVPMMKVKNTYKDIFLKIVSKGLFGRFNDKFTKENTIIINNSLLKHILNDSKEYSTSNDLVTQHG